MEDNIYEDVYDQICEMIDPHIKTNRYGMTYCSEDSLCTSVVESTEYLLEFWLLNRHRENVEHPK